MISLTHDWAKLKSTNHDSCTIMREIYTVVTVCMTINDVVHWYRASTLACNAIIMAMIARIFLRNCTATAFRFNHGPNRIAVRGVILQHHAITTPDCAIIQSRSLWAVFRLFRYVHLPRQVKRWNRWRQPSWLCLMKRFLLRTKYQMRWFCKPICEFIYTTVIGLAH